MNRYPDSIRILLLHLFDGDLRHLLARIYCQPKLRGSGPLDPRSRPITQIGSCLLTDTSDDVIEGKYSSSGKTATVISAKRRSENK